MLITSTFESPYKIVVFNGTESSLIRDAFWYAYDHCENHQSATLKDACAARNRMQAKIENKGPNADAKYWM